MTPDPHAAADAAKRVQRWLDAVREHGRRDTGYPDEDDLDALLAERARMAAELEQVRGEPAAEPRSCPDCPHAPYAHRTTTGCIRCPCNHGRATGPESPQEIGGPSSSPTPESRDAHRGS